MQTKPLLRSKVFHHKAGHIARRTCTVAELRDYLSQFPENMPIVATWEGTVHGLSSPEVWEDFDYDFEADKCDVLAFDVQYDEPWGEGE
jgi:hypothetical protein